MSSSFRVSTRGESDILRHFADSEMETIEGIEERMKEGSNILDIGANIGVYTCLLGSSPKTRRVAALEPHHGNFDSLLSNVDRNGTNATPLQVAASDKSGFVHINSATAKSGEGTANTASTRGEKVGAKRVDDLVREEKIPNPDVVKIDVEGAEMNVLRGMQELFEEKIPQHVYVEVHPEAWHRESSIRDFGFCAEDVTEFFNKMSYKTEIIDDRGHEHHIYATPR